MQKSLILILDLWTNNELVVDEMAHPHAKLFDIDTWFLNSTSLVWTWFNFFKVHASIDSKRRILYSSIGSNNNQLTWQPRELMQVPIISYSPIIIFRLNWHTLLPIFKLGFWFVFNWAPEPFFYWIIPSKCCYEKLTINN